MTTDDAAARVEGLVDLGRWQEALRLTESIMSADPSDAVALAYRTECLYELGRDTEAYAAARRLVALIPEDAWAFRLLSVVLHRRGDVRAARGAASQAVRLAPHDWHTHAQYAVVAADLPDHLIEAAEAAQRAVELEPDASDAHFVVGLVAQRRHQPADARAAYRRALQIDPDHASATNNLALLDGLFRTVRASRGFAAILRNDPQSETARHNVDVVLTTFTFVLFLVGGAGVGVALLALHLAGGPGLATGAVAVAFTAALATWLSRVARAVPRGVRRYALGRWRHHGRAIWNTVLALAEITVVYVVCLARHGEGLGVLALYQVALSVCVLAVRTLAGPAPDTSR